MSNESKPPDVEVRYSERFKRRKHRKDTQVFFWGTWVILIVALAYGDDAIQGLRSGEWVNIATESSVMAPWWVAAALSGVALLVSAWCFLRYMKLKATEPRYQRGDEIEDDD